MIVRALKKPFELKVFEALESRITFSSKELKYYHNLKQGYQGEQRFEQILKKDLHDHLLVLSDLRFEIGTTTFQIDSIILSGTTLYFFDVKNFPGDYQYLDKRLYKLPGKEVSNPLLQLKRNETLMRQVLLELHIDLPMECFDVFINPEFTLYQAPLNQHFIFPTQVHKFIDNMNHKPPVTSQQHKLAQHLITRDIGDYPHPRIPTFAYKELKKGLRCVNCNDISININGRNCFCSKCEHEESVADALLRNIKELCLLFPDQKITTNLVYEWCGKGYSKKSIKRFLERYFKSVGNHKWVYYV
ncbi:nuclease-related domain-containing protein [Gracilibacillus thailandensis]|uniref:NERD domain-containing protein n=1 Tax=Gracilibacillus thailandensis TaxID=563735 RepID=A0A6N7R0N9_9BACI|nr:nuclease-related domain-containing protein [Gracilibacillus thailandensis]MRI67384.1 NERD domain-containing protein [Gracilibacillus thailandensis]